MTVRINLVLLPAQICIPLPGGHMTSGLREPYQSATRILSQVINEKADAVYVVEVVREKLLIRDGDTKFRLQKRDKHLKTHRINDITKQWCIVSKGINAFAEMHLLDDVLFNDLLLAVHGDLLISEFICLYLLG